jgi:hypothetical protein
MSQSITGIYTKKNGTARIKVDSYTASGIVFYYKRWGGNWSKSFDTMPISNLISNWEKEQEETPTIPNKEQFGDNCTCWSPCGGCGTDVKEEVKQNKGMNLSIQSKQRA